MEFIFKAQESKPALFLSSYCSTSSSHHLPVHCIGTRDTHDFTDHQLIISSSHFTLLSSSACFICLFLLRSLLLDYFECYSGHANRSGPIVFERSLCWQHGPSSILPSSALPGLAPTWKYWTKIQRLPNQDHSSPLFVQCFGFRIQS